MFALRHIRKLEPLYEDQILVGINPAMDDKQRHGVAWVKGEGEEMIPVNFLVDDPTLLRWPSNQVVRQIFSQVMQMGYSAERLELISGKRTRVYELN